MYRLQLTSAFMIVRENMFELLLEADPTFFDDWNTFVREWADQPPLPLYLALADLARHLVGKLETGDTTKFPEIFRVVERWHVEGEHYVREAATIGLLEALQNMNFHQGTAPEDFLPWLGPETLRFWKKVDDFWRYGILIRDD
jgi:hypothetical protein